MFGEGELELGVLSLFEQLFDVLLEGLHLLLVLGSLVLAEVLGLFERDGDVLDLVLELVALNVQGLDVLGLLLLALPDTLDLLSQVLELGFSLSQLPLLLLELLLEV